MSKITLTALDLAKMARSLFTNQPALYLTDGTSRLNREAYAVDVAFFDANPSRHLRMREAFHNEVDSFELFNDFAQLPQPYVLVNRYAPGIHECSLRYFGRKYAHAITTARIDADVAHILLRMQKDCGIDKGEVDPFIRQVGENSEKKLGELAAEELAEAASTNSNNTVN